MSKIYFMWFSRKRKAEHFIFQLRLMTFLRLWNIFSLVFSFFLSRIAKRPFVLGMPWSISAEPCGLCNLQCPECPVGAGVLTRKGDLMTTAFFSKILDDAGSRLMWVNLFFQGEPMINPHLSQMVEEATKRRIYTNMSTNGHYLSEKRCAQLIESKLSHLIVSLDGITPATYSLYRKGGDLKRVQQGIERMVQMRKQSGQKRPFISVQFVVFKHNEHEIDALKKWCKEAGVDKLDLKSAQINDFGNNTVAPSSIEKYSRYQTMPDGSLEVKQKMQNHCFKQWSSGVVSWDGKMAPCCFDKDLEFSPGNLTHTPLEKIWYSKQLVGFRKTVLTNKKSIEMCQNCPEGRSWLI
jgi:radical SAM protein with 4Fe4S-binding SPASM domain